jgi:hypothetical protein
MLKNLIMSKVRKSGRYANTTDCPAHPGFKISWDEKFAVEKPGKLYGTRDTFSFVKILRDCPHCKASEGDSTDRGKPLEDAAEEAKQFEQHRNSFHISTPILTPPEPPAPPMTHMVYFGGTGGKNRIVKDGGAGQRLTIEGGLAICGVKIGKAQHGSPLGATMADCIIPASGRFRLYSVDIGVFDGRLTVICGLRFSVDSVRLIDVRATNCREVTRVFQEDGGLEVQIRSIRSDFMLDGMTFLYNEYDR